MIRNLLVTLVWTAVMAASVGAALNSHRLMARTGVAIAQLVRAKGAVQFRQEGTALWADAARDQQFVEGDVVATERRSKARIRFAGGREIALDEGSQVVISETSGGGGQDFVVTLVKGSLQSTVTPESASTGKAKGTPTEAKLTIQSGNKGVVLSNATDAISVKKELGMQAPVVQVTAGAPVIKAVSPVVIRPIVTLGPPPAPPRVAMVPPPPAPEPVINPEPETEPVEEKPEPAPTPPPEPRVIAASPPRITDPPAGTRLWTVRSLHDDAVPELSLVLDAKAGTHEPRVNVFRDANDRSPLGVVTAKSERGRYLATLTPAMVKDGARQKHLTLRTSGDKDGPLGGAYKVAVSSLADAPKGSVAVYLDRLSPAEGSGWIRQEHELDRDKARYLLRLASATDLPRVAPLLRGAGAFAISSEPQAVGNAIHVVSDRQLIGSLELRGSGDESATTVASRIRRLLGGTSAYRGAANAFLGPNVPTDRQTFALTTDHTLVAVHPGVLKRHAGASSFVNKTAAALFSARVDILDPPLREADTASPEPQPWAKSLGLGANALGKHLGSTPRKFAFVESATKGHLPNLLKLDTEAFNQLGLLEAVSAEQTLLTFKTNSQALNDNGGKDEFVRQLLLVTQADAIVFAPKDGSQWKILKANGSTAQLIASGTAPGNRGDPATVHRWLMRTLGFDGVVVARRGSDLLVAVPRYRQAANQQGLVSASGAGGPVGALVEARHFSGNFGVYREILSPNGHPQIPSGGRLLLE